MSLRQRLSLIDAFKAVAAQVIVLHHLCFYGPMSDVAVQALPWLIHAFADHGRLAVQLFLVVGGFLAARSLAPEGHLPPGRDAPRLVLQRYLRLIAPIPVLLVIAVAATETARHLMTDDSLGDPATATQVVAHLLLVHKLLGFDSLSAGLWYVAIDFQLYALMVLLLWLGHQGATQRGERRRHPAALLVLLFGAASALVLNRHAVLDDTALYFFASYALGAFAWWSWFPRHPRLRKMALILVAATLVALVIDFRERLALALLVALALRSLGRHGHLTRWGHSRLLAWLSDISYSLFLVHFPVLLLVNALFTHYASPTPGVQLLGMGIAWGFAVLAGDAFHRGVEQPLNAWLSRRWAKKR
jgi:peptidoglycan/LPS O-acetylase OafA/YrhL